MCRLAVLAKVIVGCDITSDRLVRSAHLCRVCNSRRAVIFYIDGDRAWLGFITIRIGRDYTEIQVDDVVRVRFIRVIQRLVQHEAVSAVRLYGQGEDGVVTSLTGIDIARLGDCNRNTA